MHVAFLFPTDGKLSFKNLADYRKTIGQNQNEFWKKFGVTQSGGSRYETGRNIPNPVQLLLALSDLGILDNDTMEKAQKVRLAALLAQCREEEPDVEVRLFEVPLAVQLKGLRGGLYDAGFAQSLDASDVIVKQPAWDDTLLVAVPARHPLLAHKRIPVEELMRYLRTFPSQAELCAQPSKGLRVNPARG